MSTFEKLQELMRSVGPAAGFYAVNEFEADRAWLVAIDDETIIEVNLADERDILMLSADLGQTVASKETELYRMALQYSGLWHSNDGAHLSIAPEDGEIRLHTSIATHTLDIETLVTAIVSFGQKMIGWRQIVSGRTLADRALISDIAANNFIRL